MGDSFGTTPTITLTSSGITFTRQATSGETTGSHGVAQIWTGVTPNGSSRTVSASTGNTSNPEGAIKVWVLTGADTNNPVDNTVGAGSSTTNNISPTVTVNNSGSWVFGAGSEWNALGVPASTDVADTWSDANMDGEAVRKSASSSPGSVAINFDAAGTSAAVWNYVLVAINAVPSAGTNTISGYWPNTWAPTFDIPNTVLPTAVPFLLLGDRTYVPPPQDLGTLVGVQSGETPGSSVAVTAGARDFGTLVGISSAEVEGAVTVTAGSVDFGTVVGISSTETYGSAVSVGTSEPGSTSGRWPNSWAPGLDLPVTPLPSLVPFQLLGDRGLIVIPPTDFGTVVGVPSTETPGPAISVSSTTDLGTLVGVPSAERSGAVTVAAGAVDLGTLVGVPTAERTGAATTAATIDLGTVVGVPTAGVTGAVLVSATATVNPVGVPSAERAGAATVLSTVDLGTVAGISSSEIIGATISILAPPPPSTFAGQFVPGQVLISPAPFKTPSWPWRNNVSYYPPIDAGAAFVCQDFATVVSVRTYDGTSSVHTDDGTVYVHTDDGTVNVHTDDGTVNVHTDDGTTNVHTLDGTADNCGR